MEKDWWNKKESKADHAIKNPKLRNVKIKGRMNEKEVVRRHDPLREKSLNQITNQRGNRRRKAATLFKD